MRSSAVPFLADYAKHGAMLPQNLPCQQFKATRVVADLARRTCSGWFPLDGSRGRPLHPREIRRTVVPHHLCDHRHAPMSDLEETPPTPKGEKAAVAVRPSKEIAPRSRQWFLRPFDNPWIGLIGWVGTLASVVGLLYAVYYRDKPGLTYVVAAPATRTRLIVTGQTSSLRVFHGDAAITTDVTATQIAFWNNGRKSVEDGDILVPLALTSAPLTPILEARWRSVTREVCKLDLDSSAAANGVLRLRFGILEPQDGGVLQIIYAGTPDVDFGLTGALKGQPEIQRAKDISSKVWAALWAGGWLLYFGISGTRGAFKLFREKGPKMAWRTIAQGTIYSIIIVVILGSLFALAIWLFPIIGRYIDPTQPPSSFTWSG
jgi:hypothetical protein